MPENTEVRPATQATAKRAGRYLATRVDPPSPAAFCVGETVDQMRSSLQRSGDRGRYRVFDRQPASRGIDVELIGQFVVEAGGTVEWKPLRDANPAGR